ncbi:MAG TPA: hypothetical protein VNL91_09625 [Thermoanaerobaculia bacterium]|nr:hypothetical protein [Thermoanaerobaculia bacterium]
MIAIVGPDDLGRADAASLAALLGQRRMVLAVGGAVIEGWGAAMVLHSDFAAVPEGAILRLDSAAAWGGAFWRIGPRAARFHFRGERAIPAGAALEAGLCDALVPAGRDPIDWAREWLAGRSSLALSSAAELLRSRGGDPLERAEFARLFAAGEPQEGLDAFLRKRPARWKEG